MDPISLSTYARLPGAGRRGEDLLHTQASDSLPKLLAIDFVPVAQQVTECGIFRKVSIICCPVHKAVGCSVTLKCSTRRR